MLSRIRLSTSTPAGPTTNYLLSFNTSNGTYSGTGLSVKVGGISVANVTSDGFYEAVIGVTDPTNDLIELISESTNDFIGDIDNVSLVLDGELQDITSLTIKPAIWYGYSRVEISSISIDSIYLEPASLVAPATLMCSASDVSATGVRTLSSNSINPYQDLEYHWNVKHANGDPIEDLEGLIDPRDSSAVNPYTDQISPEFTCILREPGDYIITLEANGAVADRDQMRQAVNTRTVTVANDTLNHIWYDNVGGNDGNDGLDPWGFALTNAAYTEATGELTEVGKFTSYTHDVSMNFTNRNNYIYVNGHGLKKIASKLNNDTIILADKLGSDLTGLLSSDGAKLSLDILAGASHIKGGQVHETVGGGAIYCGKVDDVYLAAYGTSKATIQASNYGGANGLINIASSLGATLAVNGFSIFSNLIVDATHTYDKSALGGVSGSSNTGRNVITLDRCLLTNTGHNSCANFEVIYSSDVKHLILFNSVIDSLRYLGNTFNITTANIGESTVTVDAPIAVDTWPVGGLIMSDGSLRKYDSWTGSVFTMNSALDDTYTGTAQQTQAKKTFGLYSQTNKGRYRHIGGAIDNDADDPVKDHHIYPAHGNTHMHVAYVDFRGGTGSSYAINLSILKALATEDDRYLSLNNNNISNNLRYGFDASSTDNTNDEFGFRDMVISSNKFANTDHCLYSFTNWDCSVRFNEASIGGIFFIPSNGGGGTYPASTTYATVHNNKIYSGTAGIVTSNGTSREIVDNIIHNTGIDPITVNRPYAVQYSELALEGRELIITGNVLSAPAIIANDGGDLTVTELNSNRLGGNADRQPNWVDAANGDFSPLNVTSPVAVTLDPPDAYSNDWYAYDASAAFTTGYVDSYEMLSGSLPEGLVLDYLSGIIYGKATELGTFNIAIRGTSVGGSADTSAATITITLLPVPNLSGIAFDPMDSKVDSGYTYDSADMFSGLVDSYSVNGAIPTGLRFSTTTGRFSGTLSSAGTFSGISVTATNGSGTATSAAADIVIGVPALALTLGSTSYLSIANTFDAIDSTIVLDISIASGFTSGVVIDDDSATSGRLELVVSGARIYNYIDLEIDDIPISSGSDQSSIFDGNVRRWILSSPSSSQKMARFGSNYDLSSFLAGATIKNISITKGGLTSTWAIDSGSTTTETPTIDELAIGNITFHNVVGGDWS